MAGEQSKGYSSLAQPNMLALQVTIIFVICLMRRVSNTDDPLHNVIFRAEVECLLNRGDCHRKVQTKENVSAGMKRSGGCE